MSCGVWKFLSLHIVHPFLELMATTITKSTSVVYHWSARHLHRTRAIHAIRPETKVVAISHPPA